MSAYRAERDREGHRTPDAIELSIAMVGPLFAERASETADQINRWEWDHEDDDDEKKRAAILDLQWQAFKEGRAIAEAEMRRASRAVTA